MSESFHVNMSYFGSVVLWISKKIFFNDLTNFCIFMIIFPLKRIWPFIWIIYNSLYPRMICTKFDWNWPTGSENFFFDINTSEYGFPYCGPSRPLGTMLWRNLNLHYMRKLSCKYGLFWLIGSEDFEMTPTPFLYLSPLWRGYDPIFD
jgi:hypothetical protein